MVHSRRIIVAESESIPFKYFMEVLYNWISDYFELEC